MAYTDRRPDTNRAAKTIAVSAIHAAVIYALVTGLSVEILKPDVWVLPTDHYFDDPPLPVPPEPTPTRTPDVTKFVPPVPFPVPDLPTLDVFRFDLGPLQRDKPQLRPPPKQISTPSFAPKQVKLRNDPAGWVSTNDYPPRDIREGNEGTARFLLSIDANGKVQDCKIMSSSGHLGLDEATCRNVTRRARFESASNAAGERVAGAYSGTVRWVIP